MADHEPKNPTRWTRRERKERRIAARVERLRQHLAEKQDIDNAEGSHCQPYGNTETSVAPADNVPHTHMRPYKLDRLTDEIWRILINYQLTYSSAKPDIWGTLRTKAWSYQSVQSFQEYDLIFGNTPFLFYPAPLWTKGPPSHQEVMESCVEACQSALTDGSVELSIGKLVAQLVYEKHEPADVVHALSIFPEAIGMKYPISVPDTFLLTAAAGHDWATLWDAVPKHSFLDIKRGENTIVAGMDTCRRIWPLWPPTQTNVETFSNIQPGAEKFGIAPLLEGGVICITEGAVDALYIPEGWLHTVLTVDGGFAYRISWK